MIRLLGGVLLAIGALGPSAARASHIWDCSNIQVTNITGNQATVQIQYDHGSCGGACVPGGCAACASIGSPIRFTWGDGTFTDVSSGAVCCGAACEQFTQIHNYAGPGYYTVTVQYVIGSICCNCASVPTTGCSAAVNIAACANPVVNGSFEGGSTAGWTYVPGTATSWSSSSAQAFCGSFAGRLGLTASNPNIYAAYQDVAIPAGSSATLSFQWRLLGDYCSYSFFGMQVRDTSNVILATPLANTCCPFGSGSGQCQSCGSGGTDWATVTYDMTPFAGQVVRLWFQHQTNSGVYTCSEAFFDCVAMTVCQPTPTCPPTLTVSCTPFHSPTPTYTLMPSPSATPTESATETETATSTSTASVTPTSTATATISCPVTLTVTCTKWATNTSTMTETSTETETSTMTESGTATETRTATPVATPDACGGSCAYSTIVLDCWSGVGCSVCGSTNQLGQISGFNTCGFADPCTAGSVVKRVSAILYTTSCGIFTASTSVNGVPLGSSNTVSSCACGACEQFTHTSACYPAGFPSYVYGGTNQFEINVPGGSNFYVSYVDLSICCGAPASPTITCPPTLSVSCTPWATTTALPSGTNTPSDTVTPSDSGTSTPSRTATPTTTHTRTETATPTISETASISLTRTISATATESPFLSPTQSPTATISGTSTVSGTGTDSPTVTDSSTVTSTRTVSGTPSESPTATVSATVTVSSTSTASPTLGVPNLNNSQTLKLNAPAGNVAPGALINYTIAISNNGGLQANAVTLTDTLDPNVTIVPASCSTSQGAVTFCGSTVLVNIGNIVSGGAVTVSFAVTVNGGLANGTSICNSASINCTNCVPSALTVGPVCNMVITSPTTTGTATNTRTPTETATVTASATESATATVTPTATSSATHSATPTATGTSSATSTPTHTETRTFTPTETASVTPTRTDTPTPTVTALPSGMSVFPNPLRVSSGSGAAIAYRLGAVGEVRIRIYDALGDLVWTKTVAAGQAGAEAGNNTAVVWDGLNDRKAPVRTGVYFVIVESAGSKFGPYRLGVLNP